MRITFALSASAAGDAVKATPGTAAASDYRIIEGFLVK